MIHYDLEQARSWMEERWGYQKTWEKLDALYGDFKHFSNGSLKEALHNWYRRGEARAPNPAQLLKAVAETHQRRIDRGIETVERTCGGDHVYADPLPTDAALKGEWVRTCVLCGDTKPAPGCSHPAVYAASGRCAYCLEDNVAPAVDTIEPEKALL